ncbi:probable AMP deaminase [Tanacetum coccineum]
MDDMFKTKDTGTLREQTEATRRINRLKDGAMVRAASQSGSLRIPYLYLTNVTLNWHKKVKEQLEKLYIVHAVLTHSNDKWGGNSDEFFLIPRIIDIGVAAKAHWLGSKYYKRGTEGNDIQTTNVLQMRIALRHQVVGLDLVDDESKPERKL